MTDPLYPIPKDEAATKFIFARAGRDRDEHGTMLLAEPLSTSERVMVQNRLSAVAPHLANAKRGDLRKVILEVFPPADDKDEAKKRAAHLAEAMDGLPLFAVRRAALKLSQAGVRSPDRVQLRTEAENVARPHWNEVSVASMLLRARKHPGAAPGDRERERIIAGFAGLLEKLRRGEEESPWGERMRRRRTKRLIREDRERRAQDYRDEGLDPVFADKGRNIVVSLPMLEHLGYRVQQARGEAVLVRPDGTRQGREDAA